MRGGGEWGRLRGVQALVAAPLLQVTGVLVSVGEGRHGKLAEGRRIVSGWNLVILIFFA
jgi:hypothetical protein